MRPAVRWPVLLSDCLSVPNDVTTLTLRISAIGLEFGGMIHSTTKQIAIQNGYAWLIFVRLQNFENFHDRLGQEDDSFSEICGNYGLKFAGMMQCSMKQGWSAVSYSSLSITQVKIYSTRYLHFVIFLIDKSMWLHLISAFLSNLGKN